MSPGRRCPSTRSTPSRILTTSMCPSSTANSARSSPSLTAYSPATRWMSADTRDNRSRSAAGRVREQRYRLDFVRGHHGRSALHLQLVRNGTSRPTTGRALWGVGPFRRCPPTYDRARQPPRRKTWITLRRCAAPTTCSTPTTSTVRRPPCRGHGRARGVTGSRPDEGGSQAVLRDVLRGLLRHPLGRGGHPHGR